MTETIAVHVQRPALSAKIELFEFDLTLYDGDKYYYTNEIRKRVSGVGLAKEIPIPPPPTPEYPVIVRRRELMDKFTAVLQQGSSYVALKQDLPKDILREQDDLVK